MTQTAELFDLMTEGWIPVEPRDGGALPAPVRGGPVPEVGVLDALRHAPRISAVADGSPLATFGIYRLLTAVTHRYLDLPNASAWQRAWEAPDGFTEEFLTRVEAECAGAMRLFDQERPFYQSADIPLTGKPSDALKSVGYLAPELATGTMIAHFSHGGEETHAFCPQCCAKGLVQLPVFALAGGAGIKPGLNGVPPLYVLPAGPSLYHTLLLNYLLSAYRPLLASSRDPGPLWEASAVVERQDRDTTGFLESLTWPPRRARLFPGPGGHCSRCGRQARTLVRKVVFAQGWARRKDLPLWQDPWAAYRVPRTGPLELVPQRPSENRDVWRDFPSLFLRDESRTTTPPRLLEQIAELANSGELPDDAPVRHEVFGLRTDMKAKIFEWRQDTFEFPPRLLAVPGAKRALDTALAYADYADGALRTGLKALFMQGTALREFAARARAGEGLKLPPVEMDLDDPVVYTARRTYWQVLEGHFRDAIHRLDRDPTADWQERWQQRVDRASEQALDTAVRMYDGDPQRTLPQVAARDLFCIVLRSWKGGTN